MTTGDFLFQGNAPSDFTNVVDTNTSLPQWWQDAAQGLIARASAIAGQPYQASPIPQVAPLDPLQTNAAAESTAYTPGVNSELGTASNTLNTAAGVGTNGLNSDVFHSYLDPYTGATNSVNSDLATLAGRNLSENLLPAVNDTFTKAGQFGSSRNADFTNRALRDTQTSLLQAQDQNLMNATGAAEGQAAGANTQAIQAGAGQAAVAGQTGQENRAQDYLQNLFGSQNQTEAQNNLNAANTNFQAQTAYPAQQAAFLNSMVRGYQPPAQTITSGTTPLGGTSNFNTGSNLSGLTQAGGALQGLFKKGGIVKNKRKKHGK